MQYGAAESIKWRESVLEQWVLLSLMIDMFGFNQIKNKLYQNVYHVNIWINSIWEKEDERFWGTHPLFYAFT